MLKRKVSLENLRLVFEYMPSLDKLKNFSLSPIREFVNMRMDIAIRMWIKENSHAALCEIDCDFLISRLEPFREGSGRG